MLSLVVAKIHHILKSQFSVFSTVRQPNFVEDGKKYSQPHGEDLQLGRGLQYDSEIELYEAVETK